MNYVRFVTLYRRQGSRPSPWKRNAKKQNGWGGLTNSYEKKRVWKATRPFRYDLNQIPHDYIVEVRNRFRQLDLTDRVPDELWTEVHDIVQEAVIKTIPKKKKCKKSK